MCVASVPSRHSLSAEPRGRRRSASRATTRIGVVAGDGADDLGQAGPVQRAGQELRGARRGAQHHQVAARVGAGEQLAQQPASAGPGACSASRSGALAVLRDHVDGRAAVGAAHLDRAQLLQVAGERRLGDAARRRRRAARPARSASASASARISSTIRACRAASGQRRGHRGSLGRSSSQASSAFCACSRFSAWSKTALGGPSSTSSVISSPRWAGRQCSTIASRRGVREQVRVDLVRQERGDAGPARRPPGPSTSRCRWRPRRRRRPPRAGSVSTVHRAAGPRGDLRGRGRRPPASGCVPGRAGDPHVHPGGRAAQQVRVGHVVGARRRGRPASGRPCRRAARGRSAGRPGAGTGGSRRSAR